MLREIKNRQLNRALRSVDQELDKIILMKDDGYFYITSDDDLWADRISGLYSSSILVNSFKDMSIDDWVNEIISVLVGGYGYDVWYSPEPWQDELKRKVIEAGY